VASRGFEPEPESDDEDEDNDWYAERQQWRTDDADDEANVSGSSDAAKVESEEDALDRMLNLPKPKPRFDDEGL
jgi:hypothetical protein